MAIFLLVTLPVAAQNLLPKAFGGWQQSVEQPQSSGINYELPRQTILNEYGWTSTQSAIYTRGKQTLDLTLFQMKDPSAAYGLYSYLRTPDMSRASLTEHSSLSTGRALALDGNVLFEFRGRDLQREAASLKGLVNGVHPEAQQGPLPSIWQHLPVQNMMQRTDRYILGPETLNEFFPISASDWLGFGEGAEAETAQYRLRGNGLTLLIADYPTPQTAQEKLEELQRKFNINGAAASTSDGNSPQLFAKRSITLLALVLGARNKAQADTLLDQVESGTEITWNEAPFELTQPNIGTLIVGAIIGTGVICGFVLIASLAFGGVRLGIKRLMPGRVFDREADMEVIQLGLSSKPINAGDFYGVSSSRRRWRSR